MGKYRQNMEWVKMSQKAASLEIKAWHNNVKMKLGCMLRVIILCDNAHLSPLRPFTITVGSTALSAIPLLSVSSDLFWFNVWQLMLGFH